MLPLVKKMTKFAVVFPKARRAVRSRRGPDEVMH